MGNKQNSKSRAFLLLLIAALVASFFIFDLDQYLTLEQLKSQRQLILETLALRQQVTMLRQLVKRLRMRSATSGRTVAVLLFVTTALMAVARYL